MLYRLILSGVNDMFGMYFICHMELYYIYCLLPYFILCLDTEDNMDNLDIDEVLGEKNLFCYFLTLPSP